MEWHGQSIIHIARAHWTSSLDCYHVCMVIRHGASGINCPRNSTDLICQCFLPKAAFAAGLAGARVCLLSRQCEKVYGIDIHTTSGQKPPGQLSVQAMSISPLDGSVAWAPKYKKTGVVFFQRPSVRAAELSFAAGAVFALAFVGAKSSKTLLAVGLVSDEDEAAVVLYDYESDHEIVSCKLPEVDVVEYMDGDIRFFQGELAISNDGSFFGIADGWHLFVWDCMECEPVLQRRVQPCGVAFSLDSDIVTTATNGLPVPGTVFLSFEVPSGKPACDHAMHQKHVNEDFGSHCPMLYTKCGFIVYLSRKVVLINADGELVFSVEPFKWSAPVLALADLPEHPRSFSGCARLCEAYTTVIQPVVHEEEPAVIGSTEAAEIVAQQEACFMETNFDATVKSGEAKQFHVCTLNRCTKELRDLLCNGPQLKLVRDALGDRNWLLPGGSLVFVEKEWLAPILRHLEREHIQLYPSTLVVSSSHLYLVEEVLDHFRKVWCKSNQQMEVHDDDCSSLRVNSAANSATLSSLGYSDHLKSVEVELVITRTFVQMVRVAPHDDTLTQSTSKVHCPNVANVRSASRQL